MLKWLKQKPSSLESPPTDCYIYGNNELNKRYDLSPSNYDYNDTKRARNSNITTDDPLATFQIQLNLARKALGQKKIKLFKLGQDVGGKNKKLQENEIYAVSRINPLFEENENSLIAVNHNPNGKSNHVLISPGNHSGSSGYDSNSPSDLDEDSPNRIHSSSAQLKLFQDKDHDLVTRQAAVGAVNSSSSYGSESLSSVNANSPILEQNPTYVKSITFGGSNSNSSAQLPMTIGRALLSPDVDSSKKHNNFSLKHKSVPGRSSSISRVSAISVPIRSNSSSRLGGDDSRIGNAQVVQKNANYVQSIRICPSSSAGLANATGFGKQSSTSLSQNHKRSSSSELVKPHGGARRKPSVTFSEQVDVVAVDEVKKPLRNSQNENVPHHLQQNEGADLATFSNSLSKNRIVKQIVSKNPAIFRLSDEQDEDSSNNSDVEAEADFVYHHVVHKSKSFGSNSENDVEVEVLETINGNTVSSKAGGRSRSRSSQVKSPFGGIADHYAAAKEIAKEIESYSTGTTKSTKISMVRDKLLHHNHRGGRPGPSSNSSSTTSSYLVTPHNLHSQLKREDTDNANHYPIIQIFDGKISFVHPLRGVQNTRFGANSGSNSTKKPSWKVLNTQPQVYVKANDHLPATTSGSGLSTSTTTPTLHQHRTHNNNNTTTTDEDAEDYEEYGDEGQDQVPIYEALPRSSNTRSKNDDSDSGNSTDRNPINGLQPSLEETYPHIKIPKKEIPNADGGSSSAASTSSSSSSVCSSSDKSSSITTTNNLSNKSKVMIISGDSQNMVVDLTAVPSELRTAIISGTTLMKLPSSSPDSSNQLQLEAGYTMITIPPEIINHYSNSEGDDGYDEQLNKRYSAQNKTQVWNVLQNGAGGDDDKANGKKSKKHITTILPFHPNHDAHTTPDFTLEGHRLAYQTKRVRNGKRRRCLCRICGILFFLISFLGVIVTLSLIYTNGRKYFGSA